MRRASALLLLLACNASGDVRVDESLGQSRERVQRAVDWILNHYPTLAPAQDVTIRLETGLSEHYAATYTGSPEIVIAPVLLERSEAALRSVIGHELLHVGGAEECEALRWEWEERHRLGFSEQRMERTEKMLDRYECGKEYLNENLRIHEW